MDGWTDGRIRRKYIWIRIGHDRAYPLHFTLPQLPQLLLQLLLQMMEDRMEYVSFSFWALSFEIIKFQPLIFFYISDS